MTDQELLELRGRCVTARMYNRKVANAEIYVTMLEQEAGPIPLYYPLKRASTSHLIALVDKILRIRSGEEKPVPKPKAKAKPKAVSKPKPKAEPKKAEKKATPKKKVAAKAAPKKKAVATKAKPAPKKKVAEKAKKK